MMLEEHGTTASRDHEIKALGARLHAQAGLLGIREPDLEEIAIWCGKCGVISCNEIASMECPPTDKNS